MTHLGYGKTRSVYRIGNYVIKFPRLRYLIRGIRSQYLEWKRWRTTRSELLNPVSFAIPGFLSIMPYCHVEAWNSKLPARFFEMLGLDLGLSNVILSAGNVGFSKEGNLVAIDYGNKDLSSLENEDPLAAGWLK